MRQKHWFAIGHFSQSGLFAVHTSAPSSMVAAAHLLESLGMSSVRACLSELVMCSGGNSCPSSALAKSRRIFTSRTRDLSL